MAVPTSVTTTFPASITTSGEGNGVLIALDRVSPNDLAFVTAFGTYGTATVVIEARLRAPSGTTNTNAFVPISVTNSTAGTLVGTGGSIALTDNASNQFQFGVGPYDQICVYASALSTGTISVGFGVGPIGSQPPQLTAQISNSTIAAATTITSTSANALAVGANGTTNPVLNVNASAATVATGITIVGAAAASGVSIAATSSGGAENLKIDAKSTGTVTIGSVSTGNVILGTSGHTLTLNNATGAVTLAAGGLTLTSGAIIVTSGALTLTAGGLTMTLGDLTMTAGNIVSNASPGIKIGTATTQLLGFWNKAPAVQPAANTDTTTGAAGSGTGVFLNTTVNGGSGSAFTLGGIVAALKSVGLLAA